MAERSPAGWRAEAGARGARRGGGGGCAGGGRWRRGQSAPAGRAVRSRSHKGHTAAGRTLSWAVGCAPAPLRRNQACESPQSPCLHGRGGPTAAHCTQPARDERKKAAAHIPARRAAAERCHPLADLAHPYDRCLWQARASHFSSAAAVLASMIGQVPATTRSRRRPRWLSAPRASRCALCLLVRTAVTVLHAADSRPTWQAPGASLAGG